MRYDATLRNIEMIGEAASRTPDALRQAYPDVPWRMIIATRNQFIHGYLGIDEDVIWSIAQTAIFDLLSQLRLINAGKPFN